MNGCLSNIRTNLIGAAYHSIICLALTCQITYSFNKKQGRFVK